MPCCRWLARRALETCLLYCKYRRACHRPNPRRLRVRARGAIGDRRFLPVLLPCTEMQSVATGSPESFAKAQARAWLREECPAACSCCPDALKTDQNPPEPSKELVDRSSLPHDKSDRSPPAWRNVSKKQCAIGRIEVRDPTANLRRRATVSGLASLAMFRNGGPARWEPSPGWAFGDSAAQKGSPSGNADGWASDHSIIHCNF